MNWWYQSACQRRMVGSGTTPRATARSKISPLALMVPRVPHAGRGGGLVDGVGAGRLGQAAHAVAGEQPHPHVGVGGAADGGVEQALLLHGGAAHTRRWAAARRRSCAAAAATPVWAPGTARGGTAAPAGARRQCRRSGPRTAAPPRRVPPAGWPSSMASPAPGSR